MTSGAAGPSASTITVQETLGLFDTDFEAVAKGVADARYVVWLGSGISRGRVPDVSALVSIVIDFLYARIDHADPECHYRGALKEAIGLAGLRADELARLDVATPPASWPVVDELVNGLVGRYSDLLDIRVDGQPQDFMLWEAVDVRARYPEGAAPDCEHLCLAILALEGVLPYTVSANWDGLIESAMQELTGDAGAYLRVVVVAEDFRKPELRASLLKFHGCAILAARDPATYRDALVGAQSQITAWPTSPTSEVMREALQMLATTKPTLMIGLSAQDSDIQDIFARAESRMRWVWPANPPAHIFAEDSLGYQQRNILKVAYREGYEPHGGEIERGALLRAFGKQLTTALVLYVIAAKLRALLLSADAPNFGDVDYTGLTEGITALRDVAATFAEPDRLGFVQDLVRHESRAMALFDQGAEPGVANAYRPVTAVPASQTTQIPGLPGSGLAELAAALGIFGRGLEGGLWDVALGPNGNGRNGAIRNVSSAGGDAAVFFAANGRVAVELEKNGLVDSAADDVIVIHSTEPVARLKRSPRGRFGRTGMSGPRHVDMRDLLKTATDLRELENLFRYAAAI